MKIKPYQPHKKPWGLLILLIWLALIIEGAWPFIAWAAIRPRPILFFSILAGFILPPGKAIWLGAISGLLADLLASRHLGLQMLSHSITAYLMALFAAKLVRPTLLTTAFAIALGSLLIELLSALFGYPLGLHYHWSLLPPLLLGQIVLAPLALIYLRKLGLS